MKKYITLVLIVMFFAPLTCMEPEQYKGPMDSVWFYNQDHPFACANQLHRDQQWQDASREYRDVLAQLKPTDNVRKPDEMHHILDSTTEYHIHQAQLNLAACLLAQRQETELWTSFDALLDITKPKHISSSLIHHRHKLLKDQVILVRTDHIDIGDIFCFLSVAHELKKRTECHILLSVPKILKEILANTAQAYNFKLIGSKEVPQLTHYETHLIALLGHLHLTPSQMSPEKVVFTAPELVRNIVFEQVLSVLKQGNILIIADRGEAGDQTNLLIGGRKHINDLRSEPFQGLLEKHSNIVLMDCSPQNNRIMLDNPKNQYLTLTTDTNKQQSFYNMIALARIMSNKKNIIAFGTDTGRTNIFIRSLDHDAQNRMAFIVPDQQDYDIRMEGEGSKYKHMISNCWVYKCNEPADQTRVIEEAYNDMLKYTLESSEREKK
jgi:hypothetical protein